MKKIIYILLFCIISPFVIGWETFMLTHPKPTPVHVMPLPDKEHSFPNIMEDLDMGPNLSTNATIADLILDSEPKLPIL